MDAKDTASKKKHTHSLMDAKSASMIDQKKLVETVSENETLIFVDRRDKWTRSKLAQLLVDNHLAEGGLVGVTQPRGLGSAARPETKSNVIKHLDDANIIREALSDPLLSAYSIIVVEEAHRRAICTDVMLGVLKGVQKQRAQCVDHNLLKLVIVFETDSSDVQRVSDFFDKAKAVQVPVQEFPVDIYYTYEPQQNYMEAACITIFKIHLEEGPGDILVFLTGKGEIESLDKLVRKDVKKLPKGTQELRTFPFFSSLPSKHKAYQPPPAHRYDPNQPQPQPEVPQYRKVILATNFAENLETITGIKYVIDPGVVKGRIYCPDFGTDFLIIVETSKSQALVRSKCAGREGPGKCFRLYKESSFDELSDSTVPEIQRLDPSNVILLLKALGVDDLMGFDFIDIPDVKAVISSLETLLLLGALTEEGKLSDPIGKQMAQLPLNPMDSKALLLAVEFGCLQEMLISISMMSVDSIFYATSDNLEQLSAAKVNFSRPDGDHLTLIKVYRDADSYFEKVKMEENAGSKIKKWCKKHFINNRSLSQLLKLVTEIGLQATSCGDDTLPYIRCLAGSYFLKAARKQRDKTYRVFRSNKKVRIDRSSVLFMTEPECIIYNNLRTENYVCNVTRIDPMWLPELAPQYYGAA